MIYKPSYSHSHALVIGINDYVAASPLAFAVADAKAVSQILQARFEFPIPNVTLLLDEHATKAAILKGSSHTPSARLVRTIDSSSSLLDTARRSKADAVTSAIWSRMTAIRTTSDR